MPTDVLILLASAVFLVAILYASVGHAGASGYIAVMALLGISAATIRPTALCLNILVASITTWQFARAGHFSWRLFWPFAVLAVPFAFIGGTIDLPTHALKVVIGIVLLFSAVNFVLVAAREKPVVPAPMFVAIVAGAGIGLLSGLTGTGGGIFLTPLLLVMGWAKAKSAAAVSAVFILLNSTAGLLGNLSATRELPAYVLPLLVAAAAGGLIGSHLGSRRLAPAGIKRFLAAVLFVAGLKLVFT